MADVIIHGHFYQPWRVRPDTIIPHTLRGRPVREGLANPYFNYTDKIGAECYFRLMRRNPARSAYARMSFNFGPTLIEQLRYFHPRFAERLRRADEISISRCGHGNAIAQAFFHTILPLDSLEDKRVQIAWGIEHFRDTFGRDPEGFWLPEAAVDLATLSCLASFGIKYVILSPSAVKRINYGKGFETVKKDKDGVPIVDYGLPYQVKLPGSGQAMHVFVYDHTLTSSIEDDKSLHARRGRGIEREIRRLAKGHPLVHAAIDGEFFGHHQPDGAKSLLSYLDHAERWGYRVTNYGELLEKAQTEGRMIPEIELARTASWSCKHGVKRWVNNCGCGGNNPWRSKYRDALLFLAQRADDTYFDTTQSLLIDPAGARERYIHVLLGHKSFEDFIQEELAPGRRFPKRKTRTLSTVFNSLVSRHAMFVSCAWFFEGMGMEVDISIGFAADLVRQIQGFDPELETDFTGELRAIRNSPGYKKRHQLSNAERIYQNVKALQEAA